MMLFEGRVWKFGDNVDTDSIIPARFLSTTERSELARNCFADTRPEFASRVREGDVLVGGRNFGCGSSREHAPLAIKSAGISVIIARSFARIFYRNAFNIGLPVLDCEDAPDILSESEEVVVDPAQGEIRDMKGSLRCLTRSVPEFMLEIVEAGGLVNYFKSGAGGPGA